MSQSVQIAFYSLFLLGPVPVWHLMLHAFLPVWKRSPGAFYAAAAAVWALFAPLSWVLAENSPQLFVPEPWAIWTGLSLCAAASLVSVWSIVTLTPKRFFLWTVLRPEKKPELIRSGPYRYLAHPTYLAIVVTAASNFLASGHASLLAAGVAITMLLAMVVVLEQRELSARMAASRRD